MIKNYCKDALLIDSSFQSEFGERHESEGVKPKEMKGTYHFDVKSIFFIWNQSWLYMAYAYFSYHVPMHLSFFFFFLDNETK